MPRALGTLLPALLLVAAPVALLGAACGDDPGDSGGTAGEPRASATGSAPSDRSPGPEPGTGQPGYRVIDIITVTAAGGSVDPDAVPMDDDAARQTFLGQFTAGDLATKVQAAVDRTDVPDGQRLYGAVVAVGCDAPTDVSVLYSPGGVSVTAAEVASPRPECLAAMTSVALVRVDTTGAQLDGGGAPAS